MPGVINHFSVVFTSDRSRPAVFQGSAESVYDWLAERYADNGTLEIYNEVEGKYYSRSEFVEKYGPEEDVVNHPSHYTQYEGLEIIDLCEQMPFNRGNVVKYVARAGFKDPATEIQDLEKAKFYIEREINRIKARKAKEGEDQ